MSSVSAALAALVLACAVSHGAATVLTAVAPRLRLRSAAAWILTLAAAAGLLLATELPGRGAALTVAVAGAALCFAARRRHFHPTGAVVWASYVAMSVAALTWAAVFLAHQRVSPMTSVLMWATFGLALLCGPSFVLKTGHAWEPLLRSTWARPRASRHEPDRTDWPLVTVQVPCHAEPPEVVIATVHSLVALDYPNLEIQVIDNNTVDPSLWVPVQAACERLGPQVTFLHVEGITGAKAGALNWATPQINPATEILAIVDADYQVDPAWLRRTVGYFDDPSMGFVQSPHAYRDYTNGTLSRWANDEYGVFFATEMISLNEVNAGITVGTMSLIRVQALADAGGWSEWCLTEDSELAIRIHAAGYGSTFVQDVYGRGLIPDTFEGYRKQRFRWTYGPVQEVRRHWRLFAPRALGGTASALTAGQKLHHANHGLDVVFMGVRALILPLGALTALSLALHGEHIAMPHPIWAAATIALASHFCLHWLMFRRLLGATLRQAVGACVAIAALRHVIVSASLRATCGLSASWTRTSKFRNHSRGLAVLAEARTETTLATAQLLAAGLLYATGPSGLASAFALGLAVQGLTYLASPLVALVGDRDVRRAPVPPAVEAVPAVQRERRGLVDRAA